MSLGKSIYALLTAASPVTAIVSTRIYPSRIPQIKIFPAIAYMQLARVPTNQKDSVSGFDKVDFDIDCFAKTYEQVNDLAAKVRTALDRQSITSQGVNITTIVFVAENDGYDNEIEVFQKSLQFKFVVLN